MKFEDALFNWLQIKLVADARPDDEAALETREFFEVILREDHGLTHFQVTEEQGRYQLDYRGPNVNGSVKFDAELALQLLASINGDSNDLICTNR